MPEIIKAGHLYVAHAAVYLKFPRAKIRRYAYTEEEKDAAVKAYDER